MASIQIENLHQHFGSFHALKGLDLRIEEGEFFSLLGPSGSGKTTLLRLIAGFEPPTQGRILIGDEDVTNLPPEKRRLGMVFQNYALFPHLSVFENVAYGLKAQKHPKGEIAGRVEESLALVDLPGFESRDVHSLSGGQQQRVAFARAIAPRPRVLLMDEPLSNLDTRLRHQTRRQLKELQQKIGMTTVYVTHDQSEALSLSDRLAILFTGVIEAMGTPLGLYNSPPSETVGQFLGDMNFFDCTSQPSENEGIRAIQVLGISVDLPEMPSNQKVRMGIRPEAFAPKGCHEYNGSGTLEDIQFEGEVWRLTVRVGEETARMSLSPSYGIDPPKPGEVWEFSFSGGSLVRF